MRLLDFAILLQAVIMLALAKKKTLTPTVPQGNFDDGWLVGGITTDTSSFIPSVASLVDSQGDVYCVCNIVSNNMCATSAACLVASATGTTGYVAVGAYSAATLNAAAYYPILYFAPFPGYVPGGSSMNFGLVIIDGIFPGPYFGHTPVNPIDFGSYDATYTGWAAATKNSPSPSNIVYANMKYYNLSTPADSFFFSQPDNGLCGGPSGGALYLLNFLTGVASSDIACGSSSSPALFSAVNYFSYWIDVKNASTAKPNSFVYTYDLATGLSIAQGSSVSIDLFIPRAVNYAKFTLSSTDAFSTFADLKIQFGPNTACSSSTEGTSSEICSFFTPAGGKYTAQVFANGGRVSGISLRLEIGFSDAKLDITTYNGVPLSKKKVYGYLSIPVLPNFPFTVSVSNGDPSPTIIVAKGFNLPSATSSGILCNQVSTTCSFKVPYDTTVVSVAIIGSTANVQTSRVQISAPKVVPPSSDVLARYSQYATPYKKTTFTYTQSRLAPGSNLVLQLDLIKGYADMNVYFTSGPRVAISTVASSCMQVGVLGSSVLCSLAVPAANNAGDPSFVTIVVTAQLTAQYRLTLGGSLS